VNNPLKNPFKSKRFQPVDDPEPVPSHLLSHGWSDPSDDPNTLPLDANDSERSARREGARALGQLHEQSIERKRAARDAEFAGVALGTDFSKGLVR
jgi:hypothetical protein